MSGAGAGAGGRSTKQSIHKKIHTIIELIQDSTSAITAKEPSQKRPKGMSVGKFLTDCTLRFMDEYLSETQDVESFCKQIKSEASKFPKQLNISVQYTQSCDLHSAELRLSVFEAWLFCLLIIQQEPKPAPEDWEQLELSKVTQQFIDSKATLKLNNQTTQLAVQACLMSGNRQSIKIIWDKTPKKNQFKMLELASTAGNFRSLIYLLSEVSAEDRERFLQAKNTAGETPLHLSCREGNEATIQCLLLFGANTETPNRSGRRPLDLIKNTDMKALIESEHRSYVALRKRTAEPTREETPEIDVEPDATFASNAAIILSQIIECAKRLKEALSKAMPSISNETALHVAAKNLENTTPPIMQAFGSPGSLSTFRILIQDFQTQINEPHTFKISEAGKPDQFIRLTPIQLWLFSLEFLNNKNGHVDLSQKTKILIEEGATFDFDNKFDCHAFIALLQSGDTSSLRLVLERFPDVSEKPNQNPLSLAAITGNPQVILSLKTASTEEQWKAWIAASTESAGNTLLHRLCATLDQLIKATEPELKEKTPAAMLVIQHLANASSFLIQFLNKANEAGQMPAHLITDPRAQHVVEVIFKWVELKSGMQPFSENPALPGAGAGASAEPQDPSAAIIAFLSEDTLKIIFPLEISSIPANANPKALAYFGVFCKLLNARGLINKPILGKYPPLFLAAKHLKPSLMQGLLEAGAETNSVIEIEGKVATALGIAFMQAFSMTGSLDEQHKTALHEITRLMLKHGVTPPRKADGQLCLNPEHGILALHLCILREDSDLLEMLIGDARYYTPFRELADKLSRLSPIFYAAQHRRSLTLYRLLRHHLKVSVHLGSAIPPYLRVQNTSRADPPVLIIDTLEEPFPTREFTAEEALKDKSTRTCLSTALTCWTDAIAASKFSPTPREISFPTIRAELKRKKEILQCKKILKSKREAFKENHTAKNLRALLSTRIEPEIETKALKKIDELVLLKLLETQNMDLLKTVKRYANRFKALLERFEPVFDEPFNQMEFALVSYQHILDYHKLTSSEFGQALNGIPPATEAAEPWHQIQTLFRSAGLNRVEFQQFLKDFAPAEIQKRYEPKIVTATVRAAKAIPPSAPPDDGAATKVVAKQNELAKQLRTEERTRKAAKYAAEKERIAAEERRIEAARAAAARRPVIEEEPEEQKTPEPEKPGANRMTAEEVTALTAKHSIGPLKKRPGKKEKAVLRVEDPKKAAKNARKEEKTILNFHTRAVAKGFSALWNTEASDLNSLGDSAQTVQQARTLYMLINLCEALLKQLEPIKDPTPFDQKLYSTTKTLRHRLAHSGILSDASKTLRLNEVIKQIMLGQYDSIITFMEPESETLALALEQVKQLFQAIHAIYEDIEAQLKTRIKFGVTLAIAHKQIPEEFPLQFEALQGIVMQLKHLCSKELLSAMQRMELDIDKTILNRLLGLRNDIAHQADVVTAPRFGIVYVGRGAIAKLNDILRDMHSTATPVATETGSSSAAGAGASARDIPQVDEAPSDVLSAPPTTEFRATAPAWTPTPPPVSAPLVYPPMPYAPLPPYGMPYPPPPRHYPWAPAAAPFGYPPRMAPASMMRPPLPPGGFMPPPPRPAPRPCQHFHAERPRHPEWLKPPGLDRER